MVFRWVRVDFRGLRRKTFARPVSEPFERWLFLSVLSSYFFGVLVNFRVLVNLWRLRCGAFARPVSRLLLFLNAFSQPRDTWAPRPYFHVSCCVDLVGARHMGCHLLGKRTHVVYTV